MVQVVSVVPEPVPVGGRAPNVPPERAIVVVLGLAITVPPGQEVVGDGTEASTTPVLGAVPGRISVRLRFANALRVRLRMVMVRVDLLSSARLAGLNALLIATGSTVVTVTEPVLELLTPAGVVPVILPGGIELIKVDPVVAVAGSCARKVMVQLPEPLAIDPPEKLSP